MTDTPSSGAAYLESTESVLHAGRRLRRALQAPDPAQIELAVERLERAAAEQHTGALAFDDALDADLGVDRPGGPAVVDIGAALAKMRADIDVGNVLLAAGAALGENGTTAEPAVLDQPLQQLEGATQVLTRIWEPAAGELRFAFDDQSAATAIVDLASARTVFGAAVNDTLDALVRDAGTAVSAAFTALSKVDPQKALEALGALGGALHELPRVGRLLRRGVDKILDAVTALVRLVGSDAIAAVRERVEKLWAEVQAGEHTTRALEWAFGVRAIRERVAAALENQATAREKLQTAVGELEALKARFAEVSRTAAAVASGLAGAGALLALTPLAGPAAALTMATAYLTVVAAIVLIGMDYADSERVLHRVRGVGDIVDALAG